RSPDRARRPRDGARVARARRQAAPVLLAFGRRPRRRLPPRAPDRRLPLGGAGTVRRRRRTAAVAHPASCRDPAVRALRRGRGALPVRSRPEDRVRAVKAALLYGPGDLRVEEIPRPEPGPGEVLVQVELALTDATDLKTFRRGHPLLARELPARFGH